MKTLATPFAIFVAISYVSLAGCSQQSSDEGESLGQVTLIQSALSSGQHDVAGFLYEIECDNGFSLTEYVPLQDETLPPWLDPGSGEDHPFSDLLASIPPGTCVVTATPMQDENTPSQECHPVTETFEVLPEQTTEVTLMAQCEGESNGAVDIAVGLNSAPVITDIQLDKGKFICADEPVEISVTIEDPDGDPVTIEWEVVNWPEAPSPGTYTLSPTTGPDVEFSASTQGPYEIIVTVIDPTGAFTTLSFPIHVVPCDVCCRLDNEFVEIPAEECPEGQTAPMEYCEEVCCKTDEGNQVVTAVECEDDQVLSMDYCEEVCCETAIGPVITAEPDCPDDLELPSDECARCECEEGFELTPDGEGCVRTETVAATTSQTIYHVCKAPTNPNYSREGAIYPGGTVAQISPWGTGYGDLNSRLNTVGVWACDTELYDEGLTYPTQTPVGEWIGFSTCLDIDEPGEYLVGTGADNRMRFFVNGSLVFDKDIYVVQNFTYWWIEPVTLAAGPNIIEIEGYNDGSAVAFGAEIAGPFPPGSLATDADMMAADYLGNIIFSTLDAIDGVFSLGEASGYQCPDGFALDTCTPEPACTLIEYADCV